ncbi:MAG TPA: PEP-CTERM sorting domain-containing protein, partial [Albitalea sp.]
SNGTPAAAPSNTILPWQTLSIAQLGLATAADFRLIVSPQETDNLLSITTLGVQFFSPTGSILYTATTNRTFSLDTTAIQGQGFVFGLDAEQAAEAQAAAFGSMDNVVGVFGTFVNSTGGAETLFGASRPSPEPGPVDGLPPQEPPVEGPPGQPPVFEPPVSVIPEPSTYALMLAGLAAVAGAVRRRHRR